MLQNIQIKCLYKLAYLHAPIQSRYDYKWLNGDRSQNENFIMHAIYVAALGYWNCTQGEPGSATMSADITKEDTPADFQPCVCDLSPLGYRVWEDVRTKNRYINIGSYRNEYRLGKCIN